MEKRIFVAIVLSIAVLVGWAWLAPKLFPELAKKPAPPTPAVTSTTTTTSGAAAAPAAVSSSSAPSTVTPATPAGEAPAAPPIAAASVQNTVIDKPLYRAVVSNRGGQLLSFELKKYPHKKTKRPENLVKRRAPGRLDYPFFLETPDRATQDRLNSALYSVTDVNERGQRVLQYRYSDGKTTVTKIFRFGEEYLFDYSVTISPPQPFRVSIGPGIRTLGPDEQDTQVVITGNGVYQQDGKFKTIARDKGERVKPLPGVEFVGIEDNYFLTLLRPAHAGEGVLRRVTAVDGKDSKKRRDDLYASLNAARDGVVAGTAFFGPKETELLDRNGFGAALKFGWFGIIARFFLQALVWLNQFTHNYGFAIIVLTIIIKIVLYPLQHKSIVSMKKMQKVQPKMEAIKAKYKKARTDAEQRQKMNVEMMQLYQKEGINPMAGCLPMVLQLPILWGFYNLLSHAIELRGAPWMLWIHDLSEKDPTYILPILMTVSMFLQTYLTPATGDPMQRRMFLIMPLVFGFLFKDFASGLVLYWLVQNILTIIQQLIMNKWWKEHPAEIQNA